MSSTPTLLATLFALVVVAAAFLAVKSIDGFGVLTPSRSMATAAIGCLTVGSVFGAWLAPGAPTGSSATDVAYRCGFAVLGAFAGRTAGAGSMLVASAGASLALVLGGGAPTPLALASVATGLALSRLRRRSTGDADEAASRIDAGRTNAPVIGVGLGGLLANTLLRLPTTMTALVPTMIAGGLTVVVAGSSLRRAAPTVRRAMVTLGVLGGGLAVIGSVGAGLAARDAQASAENGIAAARRGLAAARQGNAEAAAGDLQLAARLLRSAHRTLQSTKTGLGPFVPVVAPNLRQARDLTMAGADVAGRAASAVGALNFTELRTNDGRIDVERIAALREPVAQTRSSIAEALDTLRAVDGPWTARPLRRKVDSLRTELLQARTTTDHAAGILAVVPEFLGVNGPRRYLIVVPTPAEARGSGGLIGNYGEITAENGRLRLSRFGRTIELNTNGVPPELRVLRARPDYVRRYTPFQVSQLWQNVTLSPDFPSSAEAMASLYPQSGGTEIDGVISADPFALAAILRLTGPIIVAGWPEAITAENAPTVLLHDWYSQLSEDRNPERIDLQGRVAAEAWSRLFAAPVPPLATLGATLGDAAKARHLQLWANRPEEQSFFRRIGVDGSMAPLTSDGFAAITNNAGANKIEWYLHRSITYDAQVNLSTGAVNAIATVEMRNDAPPTGDARYVTGNGAIPPAPEGTSVQYVSLYSPLELRSASFDGVPLSVTRDTELGRNVYSGWIRIPPRASGTVRAEFSGVLPEVAAGYSLELGCQAMVNPDQAVVRLRTTGAVPSVSRNVSGNNGEYRASEQLQCGKRYELRIR